jgi:hypothetical protein
MKPTPEKIITPAEYVDEQLRELYEGSVEMQIPRSRPRSAKSATIFKPMEPSHESSSQQQQQQQQARENSITTKALAIASGICFG